MQSNYMSGMDDEASGIVNNAFEGVDVRFNAINIIHESERHVVLKAKRYGRWWILKGLTPATNTEANRALLRKEFDIMMMLPSEGFARAVSMEEVPGYGRCIIMEYIEGATLADWLRTTPSAENRRRVALTLIDNLQQLHRTGIVSRDIKPANIMISRLSQMPVFIDFDLADTDTHTAFKSPGGTASYISPEQATGFVPDCRNDIYSLAKVLKQMQLPRVWQPVLSKCLLKLDERIPDAATLRRQILSAERRQRIAIRILIAIVVIIALALGYRELMTHSSAVITPGAVTGEKPAVIIHDTLVTRVAESAGRQDVDSLNRRISELTDSINTIQTKRDRHQRDLEADTRKVCRQIQDYWDRTAMRALDTADSPDRANLIDHLPGLTRILDSVRPALQKKYTNSEMVGIELAINQQVTKCYQEWNQKHEKLTSSASARK